jgi:hypothetical protein
MFLAFLRSKTTFMLKKLFFLHLSKTEIIEMASEFSYKKKDAELKISESKAL